MPALVELRRAIIRVENQTPQQALGDHMYTLQMYGSCSINQLYYERVQSTQQIPSRRELIILNRVHIGLPSAWIPIPSQEH